jgi:hypothetical protein
VRQPHKGKAWLTHQIIFFKPYYPNAISRGFFSRFHTTIITGNAPQTLVSQRSSYGVKKLIGKKIYRFYFLATR